MRWPKLPDMRYQPNGLIDVLTIVCLFGGSVLVVGSLIAMSITSGMCAIMFMIGKLSWTLTTMVTVLGVEWLILVISVVVLWFAGGRPWKPY